MENQSIEEVWAGDGDNNGWVEWAKNIFYWLLIASTGFTTVDLGRKAFPDFSIVRVFFFLLISDIPAILWGLVWEHHAKGDGQVRLAKFMGWVSLAVAGLFLALDILLFSGQALVDLAAIQVTIFGIVYPATEVVGGLLIISIVVGVFGQAGAVYKYTTLDSGKLLKIEGRKVAAAANQVQLKMKQTEIALQHQLSRATANYMAASTDERAAQLGETMGRQLDGRLLDNWARMMGERNVIFDAAARDPEPPADPIPAKSEPLFSKMSAETDVIELGPEGQPAAVPLARKPGRKAKP